MPYRVAVIFYLCAVVPSSLIAEYIYAGCKVDANTNLIGTKEGNITGDICVVQEVGKSETITTVHWNLTGFPENSDQQYCADKSNSTNFSNSCDSIEHFDHNGICHPGTSVTPKNGKIDISFRIAHIDMNDAIGHSIVFFKKHSTDKPLEDRVACCLQESVEECP